MQNLNAVVIVFLVLNCFSVQIAEPLATSYAADVSQQHEGMEFNEHEENLVQQHHVRHRTAHMHRTAAHNSRHRVQHAEVVKSESVAAATEITTPALANADATESLNFQHKQQQQHKVRYDLQLELDKHKKVQQTHEHAHAHHKNALQSRTSTTTATDNGSESVEVTALEELVKPTWPPTFSNSNNNERTITVDEANKGSTQNYYQQQQHQHHHKHHKLQPAADLNRTKATTMMTSVVHHMQPANAPAVRHHNKVVHASSQINVDTDNEGDDATSSTLVHSTAGGGIKEHKAAMSSATVGELTTENTRNDKTNDYEADDVDYYDYNADDEPHESHEQHTVPQHTLVMADIGGYAYDTGIDDGIVGDDVEWRPLYIASNSKMAHQHQQLRHKQEQWQWQAQQRQLHRRQHWQREEQQQQLYESEHARVARDHHRVQSPELRNNHLTYDTSSDDEYPDDEPDRDSREQAHEIHKKKMDTLGTPEDVKIEFNSYVQNNQRMREMATEHYNVMKNATRCHRPMPRVIPVSNYTFKTYYPAHTILYRCGEDTGCCRSMGQICTVKEYENVTLYFIVELVNSSNSRKQIEVLRMRNDTECHCINRAYLTSTPEFSARGKRSDLAYRRHTRSHHAALFAANQLEERSDLAYDSGKRQAAVCRCPAHFDVFQEHIRGAPMQRHHHDVQSQSNVRAATYNCRCDCEDGNASCQRFKNGDEGFAMDDRRCIAQRICSIPNCSFGIYNEQIGRCPRSNRKHKRHNIGFG